MLVSLNGPHWRCAESRLSTPDVTELERLREEAFEATVPGHVRLDLARAGKLERDLFLGRNNELGRWVEDRDWWYWCDFDLVLEPGQRAWLRLHGADYYSWTFLNGELLGEHEGMFSRQVYEITPLVRERNRLAVRFLAPSRLPNRRSTPWYRLLNRFERRALEAGCDPHRRDTVKCQMSYGWDFAPPLRTIGLWDNVEVVVTGAVALFDPQVQWIPPRASETVGRLIVSFDADAASAGPTQFALTLTGQTFESEPVVCAFEEALSVGRPRLTFEMSVPQPRLWFPWDHGEPHLYQLCVEAQRGGRALDSLVENVGLREIALERNPNSPPPAQDWTLLVNGEPVYVRGANWAPADVFPARVNEDDYATLLALARDANLNTLRVWGGGLREKRAFYDLCDRLGLLVWQEFPLACAFITRYPRSPDYLALLEREAREIVRQVRNHPSVYMWCGGNEFDPKRNQPVIEVMRRAALDEDGTRPFQTVSPAGGDSHNWKVWHMYRPVEDYQRDPAQFVSEFGLQAPPNVDSLRRFIPANELWPPGLSWKYHHAQLGKLRWYAAPFLAAPFLASNVKRQAPDELEDFVEASQRAQARGIQIAIEHARRNKYAVSGFAVWQFNSPWPGIDWSLVDYYRVPKLAYERLKELANPVLVCLDYELRCYSPGDVWTADVWVINDLPREFTGCRVEIAWAGGGHEFQVNVGLDSATKIGRVTWTLPRNGWRVACRLKQGKQILSTNRYHLHEYDGRRAWWRIG